MVRSELRRDEGEKEGRRSRGRPRTTWTVNIFQWTGLIYSEAVRNAERRTEWRVIASNPVAEDGRDDDGDDKKWISRVLGQEPTQELCIPCSEYLNSPHPVNTMKKSRGKSLRGKSLRTFSVAFDPVREIRSRI